MGNLELRSLLIVRLSALGDVIHVLPALSALRTAFPQAKLGWAVEDRAASLLRGHPQLDRLHVVPRKAWTQALKGWNLAAVARGMRETVAELEREEYEVALDFQANLRSSALSYFSGARRRIGQPRPFSKEGSRFLFTDVPDAVGKEAHKIVRNLQLLRPLGLDPDPVPRPTIPTGEPAGDLGPRPWVLLHPGVSAFGALKAWREERFAELGAALAADGATVRFLWGGAAEERLAEALAALAPGTAPAPATGSLLELAALLERADLVVGVDSGPLHLAAALGTPVLGLYGPKHPGTYGPFWPSSRVVRGDEECSPCRHRRCPRPDAAPQAPRSGGPSRISPCMDAIGVQDALSAARELLGASRRGPTSSGAQAEG